MIFSCFGLKRRAKARLSLEAFKQLAEEGGVSRIRLTSKGRLRAGDSRFDKIRINTFGDASLLKRRSTQEQSAKKDFIRLISEQYQGNPSLRVVLANLESRQIFAASDIFRILDVLGKALENEEANYERYFAKSETYETVSASDEVSQSIARPDESGAARRDEQSVAPSTKASATLTTSLSDVESQRRSERSARNASRLQSTHTRGRLFERPAAADSRASGVPPTDRTETSSQQATDARSSEEASSRGVDGRQLLRRQGGPIERPVQPRQDNRSPGAKRDVDEGQKNRKEPKGASLAGGEESQGSRSLFEKAGDAIKKSVTEAEPRAARNKAKAAMAKDHKRAAERRALVTKFWTPDPTKPEMAGGSNLSQTLSTSSSKLEDRSESKTFLRNSAALHTSEALKSDDEQAAQIVATGRYYAELGRSLEEVAQLMDQPSLSYSETESKTNYVRFLIELRKHASAMNIQFDFLSRINFTADDPVTQRLVAHAASVGKKHREEMSKKGQQRTRESGLNLVRETIAKLHYQDHLVSENLQQRLPEDEKEFRQRRQRFYDAIGEGVLGKHTRFLDPRPFSSPRANAAA